MKEHKFSPDIRDSYRSFLACSISTSDDFSDEAKFGLSGTVDFERFDIAQCGLSTLRSMPSLVYYHISSFCIL